MSACHMALDAVTRRKVAEEALKSIMRISMIIAFYALVMETILDRGITLVACGPESEALKVCAAELWISKYDEENNFNINTHGTLRLVLVFI